MEFFQKHKKGWI